MIITFFSSVKQFDLGACLSEKSQCQDFKGLWFEQRCPNYLGFYATNLLFLLFVIVLAFDLGLGTILLGLTAKIYLDNYCDFEEGIATATKWNVHLYLTLSSNVPATWSSSTTFMVNGFLYTMCFFLMLEHIFNIGISFECWNNFLIMFLMMEQVFNVGINF